MVTTLVSRRAFLAAALVVTAVGCSSGATTSGTTTGSSTAGGADSSTTVAETTGSETTTAGAPPTTSPGATTTTEVPDLELRFDGLGPFDFGRTPADVIDAVTAQLGAPATNAVLLYEDDSRAAEGIYQSLEGPNYYALVFPVGQTVCWSDDFCAEFGGASEAALTFIGWSFGGPAGLLTSSANLTTGARQSDFPSMSVFPTCYTTGGGSHTGMSLIVDVSGGWEWLVSDGVGGFVPNLPDPETVRVVFMEAGDRPFQPDLDC